MTKVKAVKQAEHTTLGKKVFALYVSVVVGLFSPLFAAGGDEIWAQLGKPIDVIKGFFKSTVVQGIIFCVIGAAAVGFILNKDSEGFKKTMIVVIIGCAIILALGPISELFFK